MTDLGWLISCRGWNFGVGPRSFFYCTKKDILSSPEWLCFTSIIHNPVLSSFWYYSHVFLCRVSLRWQLCGIGSLHLPGHHVMAAMLRNMVKWTLCISVFHNPWGCPTEILCVILFSFFVTSSTTLSLPHLFTKTLKIYLGYHTVYSQL